MISFTSAELNAWIATFFFPLARILALLAAAPPFNNAGLTTRVRLVLGLTIAVAIAPALPPMPAIEPASGLGLLILAQQMIIGLAMGFALRLVFSAVDLAGMMISTQMGLGFATAYDPQSASQTPVVSEFIGLLALLMFLSIDGHLMVISTLVQSFTFLPVKLLAISEASWLNIASAGGIIFSAGVMLALPAVTALLITNVALGVLGRVAPQLNLIVIGFPVTILLGFIALYVGMSYLAAPLQQLFEHGLRSMLGFFLLR
ncbi:MAG: flagellar biosynthetic protein FliR [Propionivibrio sp.]|jgi:flagellar biosynthetic protein FliR|nr:flagellar biosynthetic protein FliR [Propionivibrio sp.]MBP7524565.1 flagellar biosynthetic protein FliR [Propionivibrio sp.]